MKNKDVVHPVHSHTHIPGDAGMDTKPKRQPDHEEKFGNTSIKVYFHPVPKEVFWARVNKSIAACLGSSKATPSS